MPIMEKITKGELINIIKSKKDTTLKAYYLIRGKNC